MCYYAWELHTLALIIYVNTVIDCVADTTMVFMKKITVIMLL